MYKTSCFITGHRPERFKFKNNEDNELCKMVKLSLRDEIIRHYIEENVRRFYIGGALGTDIWSGEIIIELKKLPQYSEIELFLARPFPKHGENYDAEQRQRYKYILDNCTDSAIVYSRYIPSVYKRRNYYIVDKCTFGIAVYDNDRSIRSGTGQTIGYAKNKKVRLTFINPDTAKVTYFSEEKLPALYSER